MFDAILFPMRPSDKLLSDLDDWAGRTAREPEAKRFESLTSLLGRSLRGIPEDLLAGIAERWSVLSRGPGGEERARAWLDGACLLALMDYEDDPPLNQEDWSEIRELFSAEAETLDMDLLSYVLERGF